MEDYDSRTDFPENPFIGGLGDDTPAEITSRAAKAHRYVLEGDVKILSLSKDSSPFDILHQFSPASWVDFALKSYSDYVYNTIAKIPADFDSITDPLVRSLFGGLNSYRGIVYENLATLALVSSLLSNPYAGIDWLFLNKQDIVVGKDERKMRPDLIVIPVLTDPGKLEHYLKDNPDRKSPAVLIIESKIDRSETRTKEGGRRYRRLMSDTEWLDRYIFGNAFPVEVIVLSHTYNNKNLEINITDVRSFLEMISIVDWRGDNLLAPEAVFLAKETELYLKALRRIMLDAKQNSVGFYKAAMQVLSKQTGLAVEYLLKAANGVPPSIPVKEFEEDLSKVATSLKLATESCMSPVSMISMSRITPTTNTVMKNFAGTKNGSPYSIPL